MTEEVKCNPHPKAPHGFDRNASHSANRYVCECESWEPYDAGYTQGFQDGQKFEEEMSWPECPCQEKSAGRCGMRMPEPVAVFDSSISHLYWLGSEGMPEGKTILHSEVQLREALAQQEAVMRQASEALKQWKEAGTFTDRIKACTPGDAAIKALEDALK